MDSGDLNPLFETNPESVSDRARRLFDEKPWVKWVLGLTVGFAVLISISAISIAGAYAYWNPSSGGGGDQPGPAPGPHPGPHPGPEPGPDVIPGMRNHSLPHNAELMNPISLLEEMFWHPPYHVCTFTGSQVFGVDLILLKADGDNITFGPAYSLGKQAAKTKVAQDACHYFWHFNYTLPAHLVNATDVPKEPCIPIKV